MTAMSENEEPLIINPLMVDHPEGVTFTDQVIWVMQVQQPDGQWVQFNSAREDRDEVTRIQAHHLREDPDDTTLRVWKRAIVWTMDEVPGTGYGRTAPEEILVRNEENTKRLLEQEEKDKQQPEQ